MVEQEAMDFPFPYGKEAIHGQIQQQFMDKFLLWEI